MLGYARMRCGESTPPSVAALTQPTRLWADCATLKKLIPHFAGSRILRSSCFMAGRFARRSNVRTGCSTAGRWRGDRHYVSRAQVIEPGCNSLVERSRRVDAERENAAEGAARLTYIIKSQVAERCSPPAVFLRLRRLETACYGETGARLRSQGGKGEAAFHRSALSVHYVGLCTLRFR